MFRVFTGHVDLDENRQGSGKTLVDLRSKRYRIKGFNQIDARQSLIDLVRLQWSDQVHVRTFNATDSINGISGFLNAIVTKQDRLAKVFQQPCSVRAFLGGSRLHGKLERNFLRCPILGARSLNPFQRLLNSRLNVHR